MSGHSKWRDRHRKTDDKLDYDERITAPEGEDLETVMRALLDVPPPKDDQATSEDAEDSTGR